MIKIYLINKNILNNIPEEYDFNLDNEIIVEYGDLVKNILKKIRIYIYGIHTIKIQFEDEIVELGEDFKFEENIEDKSIIKSIQVYERRRNLQGNVLDSTFVNKYLFYRSIKRDEEMARNLQEGYDYTENVHNYPNIHNFIHSLTHINPPGFHFIGDGQPSSPEQPSSFGQANLSNLSDSPDLPNVPELPDSLNLSDSTSPQEFNNSQNLNIPIQPINLRHLTSQQLASMLHSSNRSIRRDSNGRIYISYSRTPTVEFSVPPGQPVLPPSPVAPIIINSSQILAENNEENNEENNIILPSTNTIINNIHNVLDIGSETTNVSIEQMISSSHNLEQRLGRNILNTFFSSIEESLTQPRLSQNIMDTQEDVCIVLDNEQIDLFLTTTYSEIKNHKSYPQITQCTMTLENFEDDTIILVLPCNHYFCKESITKWLTKYSNKCPTCRCECGKGKPLL